MKILSIAEAFSRFPGLRHCSTGDHSGEAFYHQTLNPAFAEAIREGYVLTVILDGVNGYASSFLDEAFGNLIFDFGAVAIKNSLRIISEQEPHWLRMLTQRTFPQWENRRMKRELSAVTEMHTPWYRLIDQKLKQEVWVRPTV